MKFTLPTTAMVGEEELEIRTDFRVILEIITMLNDPDLDGKDKAEALLEMFYVAPEKITDAKAAVDAAYSFIDMGDSSSNSTARLVDWEQDFNYIIAPVNRVLGMEARSSKYDVATNTGGLHWWTFMSAYMEIGGDCLFSQIITIRDKKARGKKLEKYEREWARRNAGIIELKQRYSEEEKDLARAWIGGGKNS